MRGTPPRKPSFRDNSQRSAARSALPPLPQGSQLSPLEVRPPFFLTIFLLVPALPPPSVLQPFRLTGSPSLLTVARFQLGTWSII